MERKKTKTCKYRNIYIKMALNAGKPYTEWGNLRFCLIFCIVMKTEIITKKKLLKSKKWYKYRLCIEI